MSEQRPLAVAIGEVLWDVFAGGMRLGGAPANFAVHAAALGMRSALVSRVGADDLGRRAVEALSSRGVATDWMQIDPERPTGTVPVTLVDGQPSYEIAVGAAWDAIGWRDSLDDLGRRADAICFGTLGQRSPLCRATIERFVRAAGPGCLRVLDINFRQTYHDTTVVHASLQMADVLKLNEVEVPMLRDYLGGAADADVFLSEIRNRFGVRLVVLTLGDRGCRVIGPSGIAVSEGVPVHAVNAVGAGDAFTAAFVGSLLAGRGVQVAADRANAVGGYVVTQDGAAPALPEHFRIF